MVYISWALIDFETASKFSIERSVIILTNFNSCYFGAFTTFVFIGYSNFLPRAVHDFEGLSFGEC